MDSLEFHNQEHLSSVHFFLHEWKHKLGKKMNLTRVVVLSSEYNKELRVYTKKWVYWLIVEFKMSK